MVMAPKPGLAVVVSGPSGCGKTTLIKHLMLRYPSSHFSISATTRSLRGEEVDGVDYHFMDRDEFLALRNAAGMLEWAKVHEEFYGSPSKEVMDFLEEGRHVFLDIDVQGGVQVKQTLGERAWLLYVLPPDLETLEKRLRGRGTEDNFRVALRMKNAKGEIEALPHYDSVLVNGDLKETVNEADSLLSGPHHNRNQWLESSGRDFLKEKFGIELA